MYLILISSVNVKKYDLLGNIEVTQPWILSEAFSLVEKKSRKPSINIIKDIKV